MRHRIFIAINLPENIKKELSSFKEKWPELPARWTKKENLHITLMFLGYLSNEDLLEVLKITKEVALRNPIFSLNLKKIIYGPPKKMPPRPPKFLEIITEEKEWEEKFGRPRMVWVEGEKSKEFTILRNDLEKSLTGSEKISFSPEHRAFSPHITLGRIRTWEFRQIEPEERPEVNEDINLNFKVNSIEIMESRLKRGGPEYIILESIPFKK